MKHVPLAGRVTGIFKNNCKETFGEILDKSKRYKNLEIYKINPML